jgi:diguanylate cyclase (GGDEF)-like protein
MRFNAKLFSISSLIISFMLIIFIFTTLALHHIENNSKKYIHESLQTVLITTQEALHLWLREQLEKMAYDLNEVQIRTLTQQVVLGSSATNNSDVVNQTALDKLTHLLTQRLNVSHYKGFTLISPQRKIIADSNPYKVGEVSYIQTYRKDYLDRVFSGETLFIPTIVTSKPVLGVSGKKVSNLTSVYVATPIKNSQNITIAVVAFALDPDENFSRILKLGRMGKTGETYAFDKSARLITQSRFTDQLIKDGELGRDDDAVMNIKITDPGINLNKYPSKGINKEKRPLTLMAKNAIAKNSVVYIDSYRDYRGVNVFGVWLWDNILDIGITTEIEESEAILPHAETRKAIYAVLFFVVILSLGLIALLIRFTEKEKRIIIKLNKRLEDEVTKRTLELEQSNLALKQLSEIDPLTKIANRRAYDKALEVKIAESNRTKKPLSLLMIDIDFFKLFNDNCGHDAGDEVLFTVAQTIKESLPRNTDMVARYGGEEFTVLLTATDSNGAVSVAERIRLNIELKSITHKYSTIGDILSVSIGCTTLTEQDKNLSPQAFFKQADKALYLAKKQGRNRCVSFNNSAKT